MKILYIIIAIIVIIIICLLVIINSLIKAKNRVNEAFSTMDIYLKKRWDLIPNLVETVKEYAKHEKNTLQEIVSLRNAVYDNLDNDSKIKTNNQINAPLSKLIALAESYPELKANENFVKLSQELIQIEDEIAESRKYYNATVKEYNNKIEMIPSNIVAKFLGYQVKSMFEAKTEERTNVKVDL